MTRATGRLRRPPKLKNSAHTHPLVRQLIDEANAQQIGAIELATRAGVHKDCIREWRFRTTPNIVNLEACFNVLGLTLAPKEIEP